MVEVGVLGEDDRVELLEGEIAEMTPVGARHAASVNALARILQRQVGDRFVVSVQNPIRCSATSEPQPDLALLAWRDDLYRDELPSAADIALVVEVAGSSAGPDRDVKLPLYARSEIAEAWLVDLGEGVLEVHDRPSPAGYARRTTFRPGESAVSPSVAGLAVPVGEALVADR